jgi:hypothetical protein
MIFRGGENSTGELGNFHPALTEMMEATKQRPKSLQVRGNASCVHRIGVKGKPRMRRALGMFERS